MQLIDTIKEKIVSYELHEDTKTMFYGSIFSIMVVIGYSFY